MLLIGLSLITQSLIPSLNEVTDAIIVVNSIMLIVNLLPCFGLDGEQALSDFFETNNISRFAFKALYNKKYRSKLFHSGYLGYIVLIVFIVIYLAHLTLIAFFVYDIYAWLLLLFD